MDAIAFLKKDHAEVKSLFTKLLEDEPSPAQTQTLFTRLRRELAIHADIEEQIFYPKLREHRPDMAEEVLEALEEHHVAKLTLAELEKLDPDAERFCAKLEVLQDAVLRHIRDEEKKLFPMLRATVGKNELLEIGKLLARAKKVAPTHPHPAAPDAPPANLVTGLLSGAMDRGKDFAMTIVGMALRRLPLRT